MQNKNSGLWEINESNSKYPSLVIWIIAVAIVSFFIWADTFELDEVSSGSGKVIASSKEQVVQSLEGGVLESIMVKEGDLVQAGQILAKLDPTRMESSVGESEAKLRASRATAARLEAEVNETPLKFPPDVASDPSLVKSETALYTSRRKSLQDSVTGIIRSQKLISQELNLTEPLVAKGAASDVEVLRLKRQLTELQTKETDIRGQYIVKAREELSKANADIEAQKQISRGRTDSLTRTTLTSPVRGIVKNVVITTIGGVLPPNGKLMEIIPIDERLQIETRISPRDIAYIRPGLKATIKISAYDYSIYGALTGTVELISPDTIQDDVNREVYYYRVYIRTEADTLTGKDSKVFPIVPGMIATVDIHTGKKTVLDYLIKPFNKAKEALRER